MITVLQGLSGQYFSSSVPDVMASVAPQIAADVKVSIDGAEVYSETLFATNCIVTLRDLPGLVTPYARQRLVVDLEVTVAEQNGGAVATMSATVIYGRADMDSSAAEFCASHFLSILLGTRITALGRLEYLHYTGSDAATCTALYADGTTAQFGCTATGGNGKYTTIDVSPSRFVTAGKELAAYTVTAGSRTQEYELDAECPDCAPILIFVNSFGCEELAYCTGVHKVAPEYKRSSAYMTGLLKNYDIEETRVFKADTGVMNTAMADWFDEVLRSDYVRIVNIIGGSAQVGKEVVITESKGERSNTDDELPRFTFSYQYAQRNHNVLQLGRAGRIFDNTFDRTFN